jgi:hypothetical protein
MIINARSRATDIPHLVILQREAHDGRFTEYDTYDGDRLRSWSFGGDEVRSLISYKNRQCQS